MPNSKQFSNWLHNVNSTLDYSTSFDGFILFIYVVRESEGRQYHADIISEITFSDLCNTLARLDGKHFGADNCRFYTSLRVAVYSCGISYNDNNWKKKNGRVAWKDLA